jgi:adenylate cyclase class IV
MQFEIEIKSLLGKQENADKFVAKLNQKYPNAIKKPDNNQKNHYFVVAKNSSPENPNETANIAQTMEMLITNLEQFLSADKVLELKNIVSKVKTFSVRTRETSNHNNDKKVIFVLKATIDETTSENGIARIEFEEIIATNLNNLDDLILKSGFEVQAKWSRNRHEWKIDDDTNICLDKNAGYGYLVEVEKVLNAENLTTDLANNTKVEIKKIMDSLEIAELYQERLARMFDFYNKNWINYYGTENVFEIK